MSCSVIWFHRKIRAIVHVILGRLIVCDHRADTFNEIVAHNFFQLLLNFIAQFRIVFVITQIGSLTVCVLKGFYHSLPVYTLVVRIQLAHHVQYEGQDRTARRQGRRV